MNDKASHGIIIANRSRMMCYALTNIINSFNAYSILHTTTSGSDVLKKLATLPGADILILDIDLKDINSYQAIREIRQKYPQVKVLVISAFTHPYIVSYMAKMGVAGFVDIESDEKAIKKALHDVTAKGVHYNKLITKELVAAIKNKEVTVIKLSAKQLTFLRMCSSDMSYPEMAGKLNLSLRTIDWHRDSMFAKFNFANRTQMVLFALRNGLAHI